MINILQNVDQHKQNSSMNLVKLQDIKLIHRNLLHFYTTTKDQKEKWKKPSHLPSHQKKYNTKKSTFLRRYKTCTLKTIRCCWKKPKKAHVIELLICVQFFANTWTAACQAPLSFTISQSFLKFMSIESVMLTISSSSFAFNLSQHQDLGLEFQLQHQSF